MVNLTPKFDKLKKKILVDKHLYLSLLLYTILSNNTSDEIFRGYNLLTASFMLYS